MTSYEVFLRSSTDTSSKDASEAPWAGQEDRSTVKQLAPCCCCRSLFVFMLCWRAVGEFFYSVMGSYLALRILLS